MKSRFYRVEERELTMAKLTKLQPVFIEKTCGYCGDGLLKLKEQCDDGFHLFRKTKYWFEYECKKCGRITKSDEPLQLRSLEFIDPETKKSYITFANYHSLIDA